MDQSGDSRLQGANNEASRYKVIGCNLKHCNIMLIRPATDLLLLFHHTSNASLHYLVKYLLQKASVFCAMWRIVNN